MSGHNVSYLLKQCILCKATNFAYDTVKFYYNTVNYLLILKIVTPQFTHEGMHEEICGICYICITWASWCVKSLATWQFLWDNINNNIKALHYWSIVSESNGDMWILLTEGQ